MEFKKATKTQSYLRAAFHGPSGSGKTYTALKIAAALGSPVALIDTERGSASKYAGDVADFDVLELASFEPAKYIEALKVAAKAGYPVVVIDSLSHAWMGKGGLLDQADAKGGRFDAWKTLTPQQHALVDAILSYPGDVIATLRTKTEYVVEQNERGKSAPRKVGTAPVQKENIEYEFDIAGSLDMENTLTIDKSRCPALSGAVIRKPGADVALALRQWLSEGVAAPMAAPEPVPAVESTEVANLLRSVFVTARNPEDLEKAVQQTKKAKAENHIGDTTSKELFALYKARKAEIAATIAKASEPAADDHAAAQ